MENEITFADAILAINPNAVFAGTLDDLTWLEETTPISKSDIETKLAELIANKQNLKASAKAKLIAGEKLTEAEANIIVGV